MSELSDFFLLVAALELHCMNSAYLPLIQRISRVPATVSPRLIIFTINAASSGA